MDFIQALLLGLLQGATEFIPISSSGHLILAERLFGLSETQLLFNIVLHLGSLVAVVLFYWRDVWGAVSGAVQGLIAGVKAGSLEAAREFEGARLAVLIVLATLPTAVVGVLIDRVIEPSDGPPLVSPEFLPTVICISLVINGFILWANRYFADSPGRQRDTKWSLWGITPQIALLIGLAQGLAALPGFSRSGLTITAAILLGVLRVESARFSFLLSIPAILGALVLKFDPHLFAGLDGASTLVMYASAALVAAVSGYLSLIVLVKMLRRAQFQHFAWYSWGVGIVGLVLLAMM